MELNTETWYKGHLLPAANELYTDGFYGITKPSTSYKLVNGVRHPIKSEPPSLPVWYKVFGTQHRVAVVAGLAVNRVRLMSFQLAVHCLAGNKRVTKAEAEQLDELLVHFGDKL